ncbi:uncharacterized protein LY89DRAFT_282740 [Mollisia scopiformis]|uniref:Uncharacterized protein n=1 Tax=Mollisia scopiformis TaxID=149040 RepID=A0A132BA51_MOLSC|nr:uncharacterized protein LY89DRAFT_282740 [Mollisia scopiformis]KUJ09278.1 hypothetical protein LY89DRAFT_282740 [Mollisia scopiformis]
MAAEERRKGKSVRVRRRKCKSGSGEVRRRNRSRRSTFGGRLGFEVGIGPGTEDHSSGKNSACRCRRNTSEGRDFFFLSESGGRSDGGGGCRWEDRRWGTGVARVKCRVMGLQGGYRSRNEGGEKGIGNYLAVIELDERRETDGETRREKMDRFNQVRINSRSVE